MHQFSIRDIENLTGIKAHTLRIWEQRHNICIAKRRESRHRFYDNEDLKHILRIAYLYHNGVRVSKIASLGEDAIREMALKPASADACKPFVNQLVEASLDLDEVRFEKLLDTALMHLGFERCITKVVYEYLQKMGILWLSDEMIPAQEHFSSQIIIKKMIHAIDGLGRITGTTNRNVLLFTPEGEQHEIPLLFAQYLLKKRDKNTVYFGKHVALPSIMAYCTRHAVSHLMFHLITNVSNWDIPHLLENLATQFPDKIIVASGPAIRNEHSTNPRILLLKTGEDVLQFMDQL